MDYQDIKKLIEDMGNSKLDSLEIELPDGIKLRMKKEGANANVATSVPTVTPMQTASVATNVATQTINIEPAKVEEKEGNIVKSPMVGTFYSKSSPKAEAFVKVGSKVKKGDVLCIIEAMKLMNEIEAECDGEIAEIYVKDDDVVEYGKPLFRIV